MKMPDKQRISIPYSAVVPYSEETHRNWSNIYWSNRCIVEYYNNREKTPKLYEENRLAKLRMKEAEEGIKQRFNGITLEWNPIFGSGFEKRWYESLNKRKVIVEKHYTYGSV